MSIDRFTYRLMTWTMKPKAYVWSALSLERATQLAQGGGPNDMLVCLAGREVREDR